MQKNILGVERFEELDALIITLLEAISLQIYAL